MKKWRHVEYEDDGVDCYQCLSCKSMWSLRGTPGPYCMFCGVRFEGQHECEDRDEKREARFTSSRRRVSSVFVIQRSDRSIFHPDQWQEWTDVRTYDADQINAVGVVADLKKEREREHLMKYGVSGVSARKRWTPTDEVDFRFRAILRSATEEDKENFRP